MIAEARKDLKFCLGILVCPSNEQHIVKKERDVIYCTTCGVININGKPKNK